MDPADFRMKNFIKPEQFPYKSATGWEYDSGNYPAALQAGDGHDRLRRPPQGASREARTGELMGIGISTFTEIVGAGPSKHVRHPRDQNVRHRAEIRVHPTGKAIARFGTKSQGQGHETTYAQIVAEELGIPGDARAVEEGDTDTAPYGLGTYAQPLHADLRRRHGNGRAEDPRQSAQDCRVPAGSPRRRPRMGAGQVLRQGRARPAKTIQEIAFAAYTNHPPGMEAGLEAVDYYDPPNLTFPFGGYICVVDIDRGTGEVKIRRFVAVDDCGNIINPMIVDGQIHGGLAMGMAPALYGRDQYDESGNIRAGSFMDYLLPTAVETPKWETAKTVTPSPHHPFGAKGVGEVATVGAPPAIVNAVVDALSHLGVRHIDIPMTP